MELAFQELPLAIFTTLAPIGAGAFIALAIAFAKEEMSDERVATLHKLTIVPLLFLIVGFAAAFFHLASPMHATGALSGIGHSPLSNEICAGVIFTIIAIVYWIMGIAGKLPKKSAATFACVLAVLSLVFALFTGLAYWVDTISTWATPALPLEMLGIDVAGGVALGTLMLAISAGRQNADDGAENALSKSTGKALLVCLAIGLILLVVGAAWQFGLASVTVTPYADGGQMASAAVSVFVIGLVVTVVAACMACVALVKKMTTANAAIALVLFVVGAFMLRLVFYALRISVGI